MRWRRFDIFNGDSNTFIIVISVEEFEGAKVILKFIYSEKATKFENLPTYLTLPSKRQNDWEIFSKFCGLLRIYELYL